MMLVLAAGLGGCMTNQRTEPPAPIIDARRAPPSVATEAPRQPAETTAEPARVYAYQPLTETPPQPPLADERPGTADETALALATPQPTPSPAAPRGDEAPVAPAPRDAPAAAAVTQDTTPALPAPETRQASASSLQPPGLPPAVDALVQQAERQRQSSDYAGAAATLERALRLQSREGYLWNRLAHVRLEQGLASQAANLAARANALSGESADLRRDNWTVIADARRRTGDLDGAQEAQRKASGG
jgi:hypothetical protein